MSAMSKDKWIHTMMELRMSEGMRAYEGIMVNSLADEVIAEVERAWAAAFAAHPVVMRHRRFEEVSRMNYWYWVCSTCGATTVLASSEESGLGAQLVDRMKHVATGRHHRDIRYPQEQSAVTS